MYSLPNRSSVLSKEDTHTPQETNEARLVIMQGIPERHHLNISQSSDASGDAEKLRDYYEQKKEIKRLKSLVSECEVMLDKCKYESGITKNVAEKAMQTHKAMKQALLMTAHNRPDMKANLMERGFSLGGK